MGPRTLTLCRGQRQRELTSVEDFADAPQDVLNEQDYHRKVLWLDYPTLTQVLPMFEMPLASRATAAVRLSLLPETKTTEHAD